MCTDKNKIQLHCDLHGDYKKFINEVDQACPYCRRDMALEAEAKQKINTLVESKGKVFEVVTVEIDCEDHGLYKFEVPKAVMGIVSCPECANKNNREHIQKRMVDTVNEHIYLAGIPNKFLKQSFSKLDYSKSQKQKLIVERLRLYMNNVIDKGTSYKAQNIIFSGNMGTGKTLFMSCLMANIMRRSLVDHASTSGDIRLKNTLLGFFTTEAALKDAITETWGEHAKESQKQLLERLSNKAFLCIDDVGVTMLNNHLIDFYNQLLDERYKKNLPTFITTNLKYDQINTAIGARAADRFLEKDRCIVFNFDWSGYRVANQNQIEIF